MEPTTWQVMELACLHKQITERVACQHVPRHTAAAEAMIEGLGTKDPITQRAIRAAMQPRFFHGYRCRRA